MFRNNFWRKIILLNNILINFWEGADLAWGPSRPHMGRPTEWGWGSNPLPMARGGSGEAEVEVDFEFHRNSGFLLMWKLKGKK